MIVPIGSGLSGDALVAAINDRLRRLDGAPAGTTTIVRRGGGGGGSSSGGVAALSIDRTVTGPLTLAAPSLVAGNVLIVRLQQDGTGGHAVTWGTGFAFGPKVATGANLVTLAMFFGASSGKWECCAPAVIGRHL